MKNRITALSPSTPSQITTILSDILFTLSDEDRLKMFRQEAEGKKDLLQTEYGTFKRYYTRLGRL